MNVSALFAILFFVPVAANIKPKCARAVIVYAKCAKNNCQYQRPCTKCQNQAKMCRKKCKMGGRQCNILVSRSPPKPPVPPVRTVSSYYSPSQRKYLSASSNGSVKLQRSNSHMEQWLRTDYFGGKASGEFTLQSVPLKKYLAVVWSNWDRKNVLKLTTATDEEDNWEERVWKEEGNRSDGTVSLCHPSSGMCLSAWNDRTVVLKPVSKKNEWEYWEETSSETGTTVRRGSYSW